MSSAVIRALSHSGAVESEPEGPAARAWPRARCRLLSDIFRPIVVKPRYASGHLETSRGGRSLTMPLRDSQDKFGFDSSLQDSRSMRLDRLVNQDTEKVLTPTQADQRLIPESTRNPAVYQRRLEGRGRASVKGTRGEAALRQTDMNGPDSVSPEDRNGVQGILLHLCIEVSQVCRQPRAAVQTRLHWNSCVGNLEVCEDLSKRLTDLCNTAQQQPSSCWPVCLCTHTVTQTTAQSAKLLYVV